MSSLRIALATTCALKCNDMEDGVSALSLIFDFFCLGRQLPLLVLGGEAVFFVLFFERQFVREEYFFLGRRGVGLCICLGCPFV